MVLVAVVVVVQPHLQRQRLLYLQSSWEWLMIFRCNKTCWPSLPVVGRPMCVCRPGESVRVDTIKWMTCSPRPGASQLMRVSFVCRPVTAPSRPVDTLHWSRRSANLLPWPLLSRSVVWLSCRRGLRIVGRTARTATTFIRANLRPGPETRQPTRACGQCICI